MSWADYDWYLGRWPNSRMTIQVLTLIRSFSSTPEILYAARGRRGSGRAAYDFGLCAGPVWRLCFFFFPSLFFFFFIFVSSLFYFSFLFFVQI
jgi:hypothetical protein